ncbi:IS1 family transposase, partial [Aeromonas cavernicola]
KPGVKDKIVDMAFNGSGVRDTACALKIGFITSDDWGSYAREVPSEMHLTGNIFTQRIERNNLTLSTRIKRLARKTICFSRSVELHEKVIGAFIERHHFN